MGGRGGARRPDELGVGVKSSWCSPWGLCKAPRDSSMRWKQFMIFLVKIRFVVVVHLRFFKGCTCVLQLPFVW